MTLTLAAYSPSDTLTTNAEGFEVPGYAPEGTTVGKVAGASRDSDTNARSEQIGGVDRPVVQGGLHIPIGAPVPTMGRYRLGWEYVVTAVGPSDDPALLDSRWLVVDSPAKSRATARRLDVIRLT